MRIFIQSVENPGAAGNGRTIAAALADDGGGFAGDRRFVDRGDAFDHVAVAGNKIAGLDENHVPGFQFDRGHAFDDVLHATLAIRIDEPFRPRVCTRLAAAFRDSLREICKKQGDPQPEPNLKRKFQRGRVYPCHKVPQVEDRRQHAHDLDDEHDRIADQTPGVKLAKRVPDRRTDDRRIEQGAHVAARIVPGFHWNLYVPFAIFEPALLLPLAGMVPMVNIMLGEIIFGGVGSGLYGMLLFAIVAVFVAGLMVGRTPEYLGKKLEAKEVKMAILAILILPLSMLGFTALAVVVGPWQRLRRAQRQHPVLEHDAWARDVDRPVSVYRTDARCRWFARGQEDRASLRWNFSDGWRAFHRAFDRRDPDYRRPDLLSRSGAWTNRGASRDARRQPILTTAEHCLAGVDVRSLSGNMAKKTKMVPVKHFGELEAQPIVLNGAGHKNSIESAYRNVSGPRSLAGCKADSRRIPSRARSRARSEVKSVAVRLCQPSSGTAWSGSRGEP
jgi:Potassium-transporting ATPase A subunit